MFAVHGQHAHAVFARLAHHDFAGHDQDFLGRDGDVLARANRRQRRLQARPCRQSRSKQCPPPAAWRVSADLRRRKKPRGTCPAHCCSSFALAGSLMEMAAGLCLRVCSSSSSGLLPAARPISRIWSGKSSATLTVLVPMEPVLPSRTTFFISNDTDGFRVRQDMAQIQIHDRRIEQQAVQQVENAADAREKAGRNPSRPLRA